jgi:hypothetical protein
MPDTDLQSAYKIIRHMFNRWSLQGDILHSRLKFLFLLPVCLLAGCSLSHKVKVVEYPPLDWSIYA